MTSISVKLKDNIFNDFRYEIKMGFRCRCFGDHEEAADSHCIGPDGKPAFNSTCDAVGKCYLKVTAVSKTEHELRMGCLPPHQEGDLIDQCHIHLNFTENLESYYVCCDPTLKGDMCNDKLEREKVIPEYNPANSHEQQLGKITKSYNLVQINLKRSFCNLNKLILLDFLFL